MEFFFMTFFPVKEAPREGAASEKWGIAPDTTADIMSILAKEEVR